MKSARRLKARTVLLLLVEAMLLFSGLIAAVYVRMGAVEAEDALIQRNGFYKAALATVFCLASFYLFDLTICRLHVAREWRLCFRRSPAWLRWRVFYGAPR